MTAHERTIAQLKPFVKYLPELIIISTRGKCHINEVNCDNPLIKSSVELIAAILILPWIESTSAAHNREAVSLLKLLHLLL